MHLHIPIPRNEWQIFYKRFSSRNPIEKSTVQSITDSRAPNKGFSLIMRQKEQWGAITGE